MARKQCPYKSWSAMNDEAVITEKERKRMSMPWRIWEISVARANNWGHAAFRNGELVRLCCGENTPADRLAVKRGMQRLVEMERIAPMHEHGSTVFCVIVNQYYVWRGAGKGGRRDVCAEPEHMDMRETPWTTHLLDPKFTSPPAQDDEWDDDDKPDDDEYSTANVMSADSSSSWVGDPYS